MLTPTSRAVARGVLGGSVRLAPSAALRILPRGLVVRHGAVPVVRSLTTSTYLRMAAAATKAKAKPSAKSTTKKTAAKKTAAKKKPAAKKVVKKVKKVVKKKPVAKKAAKPKKELTPEQKERAEILQLRKMCMLDKPKQLPESSWTVYIVQKAEKGENNMTEKMKQLSVSFKNIPSSELQELERTAASNKASNEKLNKQWVESYPVEAVYAANLARRRLSNRLDRKIRMKAIHDERLPKRPVPAYTQFVKDLYKSDSSVEGNKDAFREVAAKWRALSDAERDQYRKKYEADAEKSEADFPTLREKGNAWWKAHLQSLKELKAKS